MKEKTKKEIDIKSLETEYKSLLLIGARFCIELVNQINKLLEDQQVVLGFPIQYRVKKWESLAEKFERLILNVKTIKEVQDLFGLRIILLFKRDVDKVSKLITDNFSIVKHYDTLHRLHEDQFGYSSIHEIIKLPDDWLSLPTLTQMGGLIAEIQIRTVAQHIWAEASHNLQYKQEDNVPGSVRRAIHRVSALLETVDLEFERVLEQRESYRTDIVISETKEELNVDLLEKILDVKLPLINKDPEEESYSDLITDLLAFGIDNYDKLSEVIDKHLDEAIKKDKEIVKSKLKDFEDGKRIYYTTIERLQKGVFFTHAGLARVCMKIEYGKRFEDYLKKRASLKRIEKQDKVEP
jgi:ppGpp synthetase/RelA/SpoT-type nucleotidyltranferase